MIAFAWVYEAAASMVSQFGQVYLPALGLSMLGAGVVFSVGRLLGAAGGWVAARLQGGGADRWLRWGPLGQAALILLAGLARTAGGGVALAVNEGVDGLVYPLLSARINQAVPSAQRATILSFQSLGSSLLIRARLSRGRGAAIRVHCLRHRGRRPGGRGPGMGPAPVSARRSRRRRAGRPPGPPATGPARLPGSPRG